MVISTVNPLNGDLPAIHRDPQHIFFDVTVTVIAVVALLADLMSVSLTLKDLKIYYLDIIDWKEKKEKHPVRYVYNYLYIAT